MNALVGPAPQSPELLLEPTVILMAANTESSVSRLAPQIMSNPDLDNATGVDDGEKVQAADDDRSSSLSELGDRAGIEHSSRAASEANDTEAETERLEDSPQKQRKQRNVVLSSTNGTHGDHQTQPVARTRTLPGQFASPGWSSTENSHKEWLTVS